MRNKGVIPYSEKGNIGNKHSEDIERYNLVYEDDIVMNSMNVIIGSVGRSRYNGALSPVYYVLKNINYEDVNVKYYENVFRMTSLQRELTKYGKGILAHRMRIPMELLKNLELPLPPKEEQDQIVRYLDSKLSQINKFIKAKKKQIELLKDQKQAIINQAVTKGLDQNIKMKSSGIEWLGDIPEGWEVSKLGYIGRCQNGISEAGSFFESGYPFVSYGDVYNNIHLPLKVEGVANSNMQQQNIYSVKSGDVFFTRTSETIEEIGLSSVCLKSIENATFSGFVIRFRPFDNKLNKNFSKYYFRNNKIREYFIREMNIVTRASLSQTLLRNMPVSLPTITEQENISQYLDTETQIIDKVIKNIQREIDLITEYRTTLISNVVTGKVDVRHIEVEGIIDSIEEDFEDLDEGELSEELEMEEE
ncbi:MAG: restriction endonuclease subunit S [Tissierellia bacterium]|jgi:type I restriction enzyme S subunit|nr:restriction endonuclease subunit S [Tissierellia bacterium]